MCPSRLDTAFDHLADRLQDRLKSTRPPADWGGRAGQLARRIWPARGGADEPCTSETPATKADVLACYGLLLGRNPDPAGFAHYQDRLRSGLTRADLVAEFLSSVEFSRLHPTARAAPRGEVVGTLEGFALCVVPSDYAVGHTIARTGTYEPEVTAVVKALLKNGQVFADIGANLGWFSILAARLVGPDGRVIAVEPNPWNVANLKRSASENELGNIEVLNVAIGASSGAAALETDGSNGRLLSLEPKPDKAFPADFIVPVETLDEALGAAGVGKVDVMKIDVEGAEPAVLEGAARTISAGPPVIITEFYPLALDSSPWGTAAGYLATLRGLGYRLRVIGMPGAGDHSDSEIFAMAGAGGHVDLLATFS